MDINKLPYFFRAAERLNFTRAAEDCHIAQTTMSKYIAVLEAELGVPLFARTGKTIAPPHRARGFMRECSGFTPNTAICAATSAAATRRNCGWV